MSAHDAPAPSNRSERAVIEELLRSRSNWGRWGADDQRGAINLVTTEKQREAAGLVRSGRSISLSRPLPKTAAANNPRPALHHVTWGGHYATDFYGTDYHGQATTHLDALCHVIEDETVWNGRAASTVLAPDGVSWGGVENWRDGLVTRGVLLDVPAQRGESSVTLDAPVTGHELARIAEAQGSPVGPGDALVVYCGREEWERDNGVWGARDATGRPGLDSSCLEFIRDRDVAILAWDMMDIQPGRWGGDTHPNNHSALRSFGVALVDNCELSRITHACRNAGRYEFMFVVSPLVVVGGTGSPVNPLAIL